MKGKKSVAPDGPWCRDRFTRRGLVRTVFRAPTCPRGFPGFFSSAYRRFFRRPGVYQCLNTEPGESRLSKQWRYVGPVKRK